MASQEVKKTHVLVRMLLFLIAIAFLAAGGVGAWYFMENRPKPQRRKPPQMAPLVEVQEIDLQEHQVIVAKQGIVIPAVEVTLQPRVSGEVIEIHTDFLEGGLVKEGDVLVRIEPRDYELAIISQEAQLETARYEITVEKGRQDVAQSEWDLLDMKESSSKLDKELALRQPQLRQKQAGLRGAEASLQKARLDLERTVIKAPCNGIVRAANVDVGDQASTQTALATITGTDAYWVQVSVPVDELRWIQIPRHRGDPASAARVFSESGSVHEGRVLSLLGDLEAQAGQARLLVEVRDPLNLESEGQSKPLLLGDYVPVEIAGTSLNEVAVLPRSALREGTSLWVANADSTLGILDVDVVWSNAETTVIRGIGQGTRIIITDVATPIDGMDLQVKGDAPAPSGRAQGAGREGAESGKPGEGRRQQEKQQ
jgi:RND family efflux transporter MFP subunit